jgi:S-DNA-T family DNA segregation ATPase FtsK/SpoIIIE
MATAAARKTAFLPPGVGDFFRRRCREILGLLLFVTALALLLALLSYRPSDPSLNTASAAPVHNLLGAYGALVSDLLFQYLGLAAAFLVPVIGGWGVRLMRHHALAMPALRVALLAPAMLLTTIALALFDKPGLWPLEAGIGGAVGNLVATRLTDGALASMLPVSNAAIGGVASFLALGLFYCALGYSLEEWRVGADRSIRASRAAWRGMRHAGGAMKAGLLRLVRIRERFKRPRSDDKASVQARRAGKPSLPRRQAAAPARNGLVEAASKQPRPGRKAAAARQQQLDLPRTDDGFDLPPLVILEDVPSTPAEARAVNEEALHQNARLLESVLEDFGIRGEIVKVRPGPVVTLYELEPAPGTKTSRVIGLSDDAISVRIAVIPGRNVIGIELPNRARHTVYLRELLASHVYERAAGRLPLVLGKDIGGGPVITDLARMPHLLIAGTTGSGKSVGLNAMILSLLYRHGPDTCKLILIDPKMLELSVYDDIPHLIAPVVTDPRKAVVALKWTVREMEDRYRAMSKLNVRNIEGYNRRVAEALRNGETLTRSVQTGFDAETGRPVIEEQPLDLAPLPFIVVVVDEMADLMLVAGKDIEASIQRLAQMARAAGIHLIMATQRPSVDVITGTIKANFPTRISFQVTSKVDSRTILGEQGAEQLLGQGDMLYMAGGGRITRVHGPFVGDDEVEKVVAFLKKQCAPTYIEAVTEEEEGEAGLFLDGGGSGESGDALYDQAVALVIEEQKASTSFVQRHLQIGYNRAARIIERMEKEGVVGPANHVGKREILVGGR